MSGFVTNLRNCRLPSNEYLQRYDRVGQYIHWKTCQYYHAPYAKNWYKDKLQKVVETESATILWDFSIHASRTMQASQPT